MDEKQTTQTSNGAPVPAREAIRAAIKEYKEKYSEENKKNNKVDDSIDDNDEPDAGDEDTNEENNEDKNDQKDDKELESKSDVKTKKEKDPEQLELPLEVKKEKEVKETKKEKNKDTFVPLGLPKEIRDNWNDIPSDAQLYIAKSQKEFNDLKARTGQIVAQYREYDNVLAPYLPQMQKIGVTPVAVIDRLLKYSDALAGPQKYQAIQILAKDFNIDLSKFGTSNSTQTNNNEQDQLEDQYYDDQYYQDPVVNQKLDAVLDRFDALDRQQRKANDSAAEETINNWAGLDVATNQYTKKPYFPYVRQSMFQLLSNGTVPINNGQIDLDAAYNTACYLNPEIRERMAQETTKKVSKNNGSEVRKAKQAGSSIKTSARIVTSENVKVPDRKGNNTQETVRESLKRALAERSQM